MYDEELDEQTKEQLTVLTGRIYKTGRKIGKDFLPLSPKSSKKTRKRTNHRTVADFMVALAPERSVGELQTDGSILLTPQAQMRLLDIESQMTEAMSDLLKALHRLFDLRTTHNAVLFGEE